MLLLKCRYLFTICYSTTYTKFSKFGWHIDKGNQRKVPNDEPVRRGLLSSIFFGFQITTFFYILCKTMSELFYVLRILWLLLCMTSYVLHCIVVLFCRFVCFDHQWMKIVRVCWKFYHNKVAEVNQNVPRHCYKIEDCSYNILNMYEIWLLLWIIKCIVCIFQMCYAVHDFNPCNAFINRL